VAPRRERFDLGASPGASTTTTQNQHRPSISTVESPREKSGGDEQQDERGCICDVTTAPAMTRPRSLGVPSRTNLHPEPRSGDKRSRSEILVPRGVDPCRPRSAEGSAPWSEVPSEVRLHASGSDPRRPQLVGYDRQTTRPSALELTTRGGLPLQATSASGPEGPSASAVRRGR